MKKSIVNSNHYFALGASGCILLASVLVFMFVYYQVGVQIGKTSDAYNRINQAQHQENQTKQIADTLSSTQAERSQLQSFFVRDDNTVGFITEIEGVGKTSGASVTLASISDDDLSSANVGATGSIHAHIDIKGSWSNVMRAFHLVESLPYGETVNNVRATPISSKEWNIEFDLSAVLIHE